MKCPNPNCGVENRDGAKFCRSCGQLLSNSQIIIVDKYPELSFEPASIKLAAIGERNWWGYVWGLSILVILSLIGGSTFLISGIDEKYYPNAYAGIIILIIGVIFGLLLRFVYKRAQMKDLLSKYDYIENNQFASQFRFVIKDSKFGLVDYWKKKNLLSCEYDYLKWKSQDKILTATIGRDVFDIDIHGNRLK